VLLSAGPLAGCGVASAGGENPATSSATVRSAPVVTAGPQTRDLFLTGVVTQDGRPVSGATVVVSVTAEDKDLPVGAQVPTWESRPVTTKADGVFVLRVDAARVPETFLPAGAEYVNFDVRAVAGRDVVVDVVAGWVRWRLAHRSRWRRRPGCRDAVELRPAAHHRTDRLYRRPRHP
jgi:hypothetical protein